MTADTGLAFRGLLINIPYEYNFDKLRPPRSFATGRTHKSELHPWRNSFAGGSMARML